MEQVPTMTEFDVICELAYFEDGSTGALAKLSSAMAEVNVWFTAIEARNVRQILDINSTQAALPLGRSADYKVFWARDENDRFYLLIGVGDETWDIGFTLTIASVRSVVEGVAAACDH